MQKLKLKGPAPHSIRLLRELCKETSKQTPEYWSAVASLAASEIPRLSPIDTSVMCLYCVRTPAVGHEKLVAAGLYDVLQAKLECDVLDKWKPRDVAVALGTFSRLPQLTMHVQHFREYVESNWAKFCGDDLAIALVALSNKKCPLLGIGHLKAAEMSMESLVTLAGAEPDHRLAPFVKDNIPAAAPRHVSAFARAFAKVRHEEANEVMASIKLWLFDRVDGNELDWLPLARILNAFVTCKMTMTKEELSSLCSFIDANVSSLCAPQSLSMLAIALAHLGKGTSSEAAACIESMLCTPASKTASNGAHGVAVKQILDGLSRTCASVMRAERGVQTFLLEVCTTGLEPYNADLKCYIIRSLGTLYGRTSHAGRPLRESIEKAVSTVKEATEEEFSMLPRDAVRACAIGLNNLCLPSLAATDILLESGSLKDDEALVIMHSLTLLVEQHLKSAQAFQRQDWIEKRWMTLEASGIKWRSTEREQKGLSYYERARRIPPWFAEVSSSQIPPFTQFGPHQADPAHPAMVYSADRCAI